MVKREKRKCPRSAPLPLGASAHLPRLVALSKAPHNAGLVYRSPALQPLAMSKCIDLTTDESDACISDCIDLTDDDTTPSPKRASTECIDLTLDDEPPAKRTKREPTPGPDSVEECEDSEEELEEPEEEKLEVLQFSLKEIVDPTRTKPSDWIEYTARINDKFEDYYNAVFLEMVWRELGVM